MDTLGLGATLAVIRYNDGYAGILNLHRIISGFEPSLRSMEAYRLCDNSRSRSGERNDTPSEGTIGMKKC